VDVERLAWWLDEAVPLPGGRRIGLDGLVGLIPGIGDVLGMCASAYILVEARRLQVPNRVLAKMAGTVLVETVLGIIPVVGDLFDFVWKANSRNVALLKRHYRAGTTAPRHREAAPDP
jgi:hypothetical protein